ncbi:MAG: hypothetical protein HY720_02415 [Planctomycetes bacterium]|nr:hypothetical protein [Planctomycetota bacterium]
MDGRPQVAILLGVLLFCLPAWFAMAQAGGDDPGTLDPEAVLRRELAARLAGALAKRPDAEELVRLVAVFGVVERAGAGFYLAGASLLPARSVLSVTLQYEGKIVETRRAVVGDGGSFDCLFGPYRDKRVFQGVYSFLVAYDRERQPVSVQEHPGTPEESRSWSTLVRVGDEAGEAAEKEEERRAYLEYVKALDRLAAAHESEARAAALKEKYTIGANRDFDELSWRRWASEWRESLDREVTRELLDAREEKVLALILPDAFQAILTLASYQQELHKIDSREVYEHHGRAFAPEDRTAEGGALFSRPAVLQQIAATRKRLDALLAAPEEDGAGGEEDRRMEDGKSGEEGGGG